MASFYLDAAASDREGNGLVVTGEHYLFFEPTSVAMISLQGQEVDLAVEPHGQEPVAPMLRRNPPKLQSSFAKASEDTRIPARAGARGFLRRRVNWLHGCVQDQDMTVK